MLANYPGAPGLDKRALPLVLGSCPTTPHACPSPTSYGQQTPAARPRGVPREVGIVFSLGSGAEMGGGQHGLRVA